MEQQPILIVGAGPTGLACALSLHLFAGVPADRIEIFEKRLESPSRENLLFLSWLGQSRLAALGVLPILRERNLIGDCEKFIFIDDIEAINATVKYKPKLPDPAVQSGVTVSGMIQAQGNGMGIVVAKLADLENSLRERVRSLGIKISFSECSLRLNGNQQYDLSVNGKSRPAQLVILAEGSQRVICKRDLQLSVASINPPQRMIGVNLTPLEGGFGSIWKRKEKGVQLNQILAGDACQGRPGLIFVGYPEELEGARRTEFVKHAVRDHLKRVDPKCDIVSVEEDFFIVEDTILSQLAVANVLIVGDAARTGHFLSGLGCQFGFIHDADLVCRVVRQLEAGVDAQSAYNAFDKDMKSGATVYFEYNAPRWYGGSKL